MRSTIQAAAAEELGLDPAAVAIAATGKIGEALPMDNVLDGIRRAASARPRRRRRRVRDGDHDDRRLPQALHGALRRRHALRPGEGRRDDPARVRDDALLRPDRRRRRGRRGGAAAGGRGLLRTDHRRRPDEHQRHRPPAGERRVGPPAAGRAARRRPAAARDRDRLRRRGRRPGSAAPGSSRPPTRTRPSGPRGRSPTRRWSRRRCSAATRTGAGSPRRPEWAWSARSCRSWASTTSTPASSPRESDEVELTLRLGRGQHAAHVWFSDLGYEYVRINAEYTT